MIRDTWLLKGIVQIPFIHPCQILPYNSLNLLRLQTYGLGESKIPLGILGPSMLYTLKPLPKPTHINTLVISTGMDHKNTRFTNWS